MILCHFESAAVSNSIMATVNDKPITSTDFKRRLDLAVKTNSIKSSDDVADQILSSLIEEKLVAQAAIEMNIQVAEVELKSSITKIAEENSLSYDKFLQSLSAQDIDIEEFKAMLKAQLLWSKIIRSEIANSISISEQEIMEQFNIMKSHQSASKNIRLKLAEIVISDANDNKKALGMVKALNNGADFGKMAGEFSSSISKDESGVIGWLHISQLSNEVAASLMHLSVGQISRPIKINDSIYIFKILDKQVIPSKKKFGSKPTQQEREEISRYINIVKTNTKIKNYLDAMRDKYFIEIF